MSSSLPLAPPSTRHTSRSVGSVPASHHAQAGQDEHAHSEQMRAVFSSGEQQAALDVKALLAAPDKLKKACRDGIPWGQRRDVWGELVRINTDRQSDTLHACRLHACLSVAHCCCSACLCSDAE